MLVCSGGLTLKLQRSRTGRTSRNANLEVSLDTSKLSQNSLVRVFESPCVPYCHKNNTVCTSNREARENNTDASNEADKNKNKQLHANQKLHWLRLFLLLYSFSRFLQAMLTMRVSGRLFPPRFPWVQQHSYLYYSTQMTVTPKTSALAVPMNLFSLPCSLILALQCLSAPS